MFKGAFRTSAAEVIPEASASDISVYEDNMFGERGCLLNDI